jgi:hypothetical protein
LKQENDFVSFRNESSQMLSVDYTSNILSISSGKVIAKGDMQSLLNNIDITYSNNNNACFKQFFKDCVALYDVSELKLSAKTLTDSCYYNMFSGCVNIKNYPQIEATSLSENCYYNMFAGCISLTKPLPLPIKELTKSCYEGMFSGCTGLTETSTLSATILAESCYKNMYKNCIGLTETSTLKAIELTKSCYEGMFEGCTSLEIAPKWAFLSVGENSCYCMFKNCISLIEVSDILSENSAYYSFNNMFAGCTSLIKAPKLHFKELTQNACSYMFDGCLKLNHIEVNFTEWTYEPYYWVRGVAATGDFIKPVQLQDYYGYSYIPSKWKVTNIIGNNQPLTFTALSNNSSVRIIVIENEQENEQA